MRKRAAPPESVADRPELALHLFRLFRLLPHQQAHSVKLPTMLPLGIGEIGVGIHPVVDLRAREAHALAFAHIPDRSWRIVDPATEAVALAFQVVDPEEFNLVVSRIDDSQLHRVDAGVRRRLVEQGEEAVERGARLGEGGLHRLIVGRHAYGLVLPRAFESGLRRGDAAGQQERRRGGDQPDESHAHSPRTVVARSAGHVSPRHQQPAAYQMNISQETQLLRSGVDAHWIYFTPRLR